MTLADPILGGHDGFLSPPHANDIHLVHCEVRATQVQPAEHLRGVSWPADALTRSDEIVLGTLAGPVTVEDAFPRILERPVALFQKVAEVVQLPPCHRVQVDELDKALPLDVQRAPERLQLVPVASILAAADELLESEAAVAVDVQGLAPGADDVAVLADHVRQELGQDIPLLLRPLGLGGLPLGLALAGRAAGPARCRLLPPQLPLQPVQLGKPGLQLGLLRLHAPEPPGSVLGVPLVAPRGALPGLLEPRDARLQGRLLGLLAPVLLLANPPLLCQPLPRVLAAELLLHLPQLRADGLVVLPGLLQRRRGLLHLLLERGVLRPPHLQLRVQPLDLHQGAGVAVRLDLVGGRLGEGALPLAVLRRQLLLALVLGVDVPLQRAQFLQMLLLRVLQQLRQPLVLFLAVPQLLPRPLQVLVAAVHRHLALRDGLPRDLQLPPLVLRRLLQQHAYLLGEAGEPRGLLQPARLVRGRHGLRPLQVGLYLAHQVRQATRPRLRLRLVL